MLTRVFDHVQAESLQLIGPAQRPCRQDECPALATMTISILAKQAQHTLPGSPVRIEFEGAKKSLAGAVRSEIQSSE